MMRIELVGGGNDHIARDASLLRRLELHEAEHKGHGARELLK